jgi:predicted ATP-grasp superfamily ATP-dependent carboligase
LNIKKRILLTGARAPATLDLARLFTEAGYTVMVAETSKWHLCSVSKAVKKSFVVPAPIYSTKKYAHGIIEIVIREKIDLIIPTCEEVFALAIHHKEISKYCALLCDPMDQLEPLHNKAKFIDILKEKGFAFPETALFTSKEDLLKISKGWDKVVLKPVYSRFADGVVIGKRDEIDHLKLPAVTKKKQWVAQEFIEGKRFATYGYAKDGLLLAHVTYPMEYCIGEIGSALAFKSIDNKGSFELMERLVKELSYTGQISLDLIEKEDGTVVPIECNPRAISGLHLFEKGDMLPKIMTDGAGTTFIKAGREAQLTIPLLLFGGITKNLRGIFTTLRSGRDVIFHRKDIWPALFSPILIVYFAVKALRTGKTLVGASTYDMEWNGSE